jgi:DNA (cytosine-5)-methyltransferase 1
VLTFGELFAGIGGFSLGLERAGMKCRWQVEIDPYANAVLRKHWPEVPKHDDVRTFPPQGDYAVDVICGGFPCQDISVAGKGVGLAGARSGLWHEFARIIGDLRPRYVVVENVAALLARGMGRVLSDLSALGYDAEWHVVPASAVGAPHRRERVWIIGVRRWLGREAHASRSDANGIGSHRAEVNFVGGVELRDEQDGIARSVREDVPDANDQGESDVPVDDVAWRGLPESSCGIASDADRPRRIKQRRPEPTSAEQSAAECGGWWSVEPDVGRVAHGVPSRVDRLRCFGNAVVPQVVEIIGKAIVKHEVNEETRWNRDCMDARRR